MKKRLEMLTFDVTSATISQPQSVFQTRDAKKSLHIVVFVGFAAELKQKPLSCDANLRSEDSSVLTPRRRSEKLSSLLFVFVWWF